MRPLIGLTVGGVLIIVLVAGAIASTMRAADRTLTEADNGGSIVTRVGEHVAIELEEPGATGYLWSLESDGAPQLALVGGDMRRRDTAPGITGGSVTRVLRFAARETGETQLRLGLSRPWETAAPPARTFVVTVRVDP